MKGATIGEKICAAVLSEQLGISMESAWKKHVRGRTIDPSWQAAGELLMRPKTSTDEAPAEDWQERVNAALEEMVLAMRILAHHQPAGTNGLTAACSGNGDGVEVTYTVANVESEAPASDKA